MADSDHPELRIETEPGSSYALSGKIMLTAIVILFAVVVFMGSLHLYARWYLVRLRRRQAERRRNRRSVPRSHIVFYADSRPAAADRGLELKVLTSLPLFLYSTAAEDQPPPECAVCLSEFEDKEIGRLLPKCNHSFHIDCIDMWFRSHSTCPLCRSPVEHVPERVTTAAEKPTPTVEIENDSVPGPSSRSGEGETASLGNRRKGLELVGVRIDVPLRTELLNELTQSSPASRLLSLRRILSMGRKSPIGCPGQTTPCIAGTSGGPPEVDLESGLIEATRNLDRVQTSS